MSPPPVDADADGFTAEQLFSQGARPPPPHDFLPPLSLTTLRLRLCPPHCAGVSYTYDDCIFHPGHIYFSADEARARGCPARSTVLLLADPFPPHCTARAWPPRPPSHSRSTVGTPPGGLVNARDAEHRARHTAGLFAHGHRCGLCTPSRLREFQATAGYSRVASASPSSYPGQ
jgi:hypothetical protein